MHKNFTNFRANIELTSVVDPVQVCTQQDAIGKNLLAAALNRYNMSSFQRFLTGFACQRTATVER